MVDVHSLDPFDLTEDLSATVKLPAPSPPNAGDAASAASLASGVVAGMEDDDTFGLMDNVPAAVSEQTAVNDAAIWPQTETSAGAHTEDNNLIDDLLTETDILATTADGVALETAATSVLSTIDLTTEGEEEVVAASEAQMLSSDAVADGFGASTATVLLTEEEASQADANDASLIITEGPNVTTLLDQPNSVDETVGEPTTDAGHGADELGNASDADQTDGLKHISVDAEIDVDADVSMQSDTDADAEALMYDSVPCMHLMHMGVWYPMFRSDPSTGQEVFFDDEDNLPLYYCDLNSFSQSLKQAYAMEDRELTIEFPQLELIFTEDSHYMQELSLCDLDNMKNALLESFDEAYDASGSPLRVVVVDRPHTAGQLARLRYLMTEGGKTAANPIVLESEASYDSDEAQLNSVSGGLENEEAAAEDEDEDEDEEASVDEQDDILDVLPMAAAEPASGYLPSPSPSQASTL
ncbi:hypothetical protein THASP1DRAFT_33362, partial [Thamnocephalis sphaerospora]